MNASRQRGVTLLEMLFVLLVVTGAIGVLAVTYSSTDIDRKVAATTQQLAALRTVIAYNWRGQNSYASVTTAAVQPLLPPEVRPLQVPFGGTYTIAPSAWGTELNAAFDITTPRTARETCSRLALTAASQFDTVIIGATQVTTGSGQQPDPTAVGTACAVANNATIWRSL